jgi:hypothetical protein
LLLENIHEGLYCKMIVSALKRFTCYLLYLNCTPTVAKDGFLHLALPAGESYQSLFEGITIHGSEATDFNLYLKLSLRNELSKRLSPQAGIILPGEDNFTQFNARYTDYERPQYIAAVQVAVEQDVIETVSRRKPLSKSAILM